MNPYHVQLYTYILEGEGYFLREELQAILNQIIIHVFVYNFIGGGHQRMYQRWY